MTTNGLGTLGWAAIGVMLLQQDQALPTSIIEWVTLLILLLNAYLSWRKTRG